MSESQHGPSQGERPPPPNDLVSDAQQGDDAHQDENNRKAFKVIIDSLLRICTNAQHMLDRDERWHVRKNPSANDVMDVVFDSMRDCEQEYRRWRKDPPKKGVEGPHPLGAVAEHLVAKTLATLGGEEAVKDLSKWMRKAESKFSEPPSQ